MAENLRWWKVAAAILLFPVALAVMLPVIVLFAAAFYLRAIGQAFRMLIPSRRPLPETGPRPPHLSQAPTGNIPVV